MGGRLLAAAAALALIFAVPVMGSASSGPQVVDQAGDANGLNGQGLGLIAPFGPGVITPVQYDRLDIRSVEFSTITDAQGRSDLVVRLATTASPGDAGDPTPRQYQVSFEADCPPLGLREVVSLVWNVTPDTSPVPDYLPIPFEPIYVWTRGATIGTCTEVGSLPASYVDGNSLVFVVPLADTGISGTLTRLRANARLRPRASYPYPVMDEADGGSAEYVVGS